MHMGGNGNEQQGNGWHTGGVLVTSSRRQRLDSKGVLSQSLQSFLFNVIEPMLS